LPRRGVSPYSLLRQLLPWGVASRFMGGRGVVITELRLPATASIPYALARPPTLRPR
jgi:hypothetical protein